MKRCCSSSPLLTNIITIGHIILKNFLMSSNSPKKRTNKFVVVVKTNLFVHFLGEFKDTKSLFKIICPLFDSKEVQIKQDFF